RISIYKFEIMKNRPLLLLFALLLSVFNGCAQQNSFPTTLNNSKSESHIRILGTKTFFIVPSEYKYVKELARYQKSNSLYFQVISTDVGQGNGFDADKVKQSISEKGAKVGILQDITVNGYSGIYGEGPSKYAGETKMMMFFGGEDFIVMIAGVFKNNDVEGKKELQEILKSIHFDEQMDIDPMELADFEVDLSLTEFQYTMTASNMFVFTKSGKKSNVSKDSKESTFSIAMMPKMSFFDAEKFINDLPWRYGALEGIFFKNEKSQTIKIGNYEALYIESEFDSSGEKGTIYLVVLLGQKKSIFFSAVVLNESEELINKYKETVASIIIQE
ncbi:MAG: hypothetical protein AAFQ94_05765, partial [Bacteroidota bacterium]